MGNSFRFKNTAILIIILVTGLLGFLFSLQNLISLFKGDFYWLILVGDALFLLAFSLVFVYGLKFTNSSKYFFNSVILTDALIILLTGVLFPYESASVAISKIIQLLSLSAYGALIIFLFSWENVRNGRLLFLFVCAMETAIAVYSTITAVDLGYDSFFEVVMLWLRPVLAGAVTLCYLTRMKEKAES